MWENVGVVNAMAAGVEISPAPAFGGAGEVGGMSRWLNKIHCGDCLRLLAKMPPESVDIAVTSPPYNLKNSTGNGLKNGNGGKWPRAELINGYHAHDDCMPRAEYVRWQRECIAAVLRVLKPTGALFYNHKPRVQAGLAEDPMEIIMPEFPLRQVVIWRRKGGINFNPGYFLPTYECVYIIAKPKFKLAKGANALGDVWDLRQENGSNPHPAPFPPALARRCVQATTGKIILDPFMGSGTAALAALELGRDYIGIDNSAEYCRMARERIRAWKRRVLQ